MALSAPVHRTIMVVDVAGFSGPARSVTNLLQIRKGLDAILNSAFAESGIDPESCLFEDRGDGALILVPPVVPKTRLVGPFTQRLVAGLRRHNAMHTAEASIRLRLAIHAGDVHQDERGMASTAINFACRIVDSATPKAALRESAGELALVVSDVFYREVIAHDPGADPSSYQRFPVAVKEVSAEAWLHLPDPRPARVTKDDSYETVLPLWAPEETDWLSGRLSEVTSPNMPALVRRAGVSAPVPHDSAWDVFRELNDFTAPPDGLSPALLFLDLLADEVGGELRNIVTPWVERQVRKLRLEPALRASRLTRTPLPERPRLHVLIAVQPDSIDPRLCYLSYWRQEDPGEWPPPRGAIQEVHLDELEDHVDQVLTDSASAWRDQENDVTIEFLLPRSLLNLPVHRWTHYPVVLRSLERMRAKHWHRVWRARWQAMVENPSADQVYFGHGTDLERSYHIDAILSDPQWVTMVLAKAPAAHPRNGGDELTAALRAGLPVVIWHPEASAEVLREVVPALIEEGGLINLPTRVRDSRRALPPSGSGSFAKDLVVLWDDPRRVVVLDEPLISPPQ